MSTLLTRAARGEWTERPPVWLMRQAGRHIPEYREIRSRVSFREAVETPDIAARITMLPWELYEPDGLVIFSDILTALEPLGFNYRIEEGVGPVIENPIEGPGDVKLEPTPVTEELEFVGDLLDTVSVRVTEEVALIGFAGGPFTLASYIVAGGVSHRHTPIRKFRVRHPDAFDTLLSTIADVVRQSLEYQIEHGADVVQLFDTYASILTPADYERFVLPLHREILEGLDVPSIVFVRNMGGRLDMLESTGADVVSLDWTVDMAAARAELGETPVQGNLDPQYLFGDPESIEQRTRELVDAAGASGHILNLGHGVDKETPVEHVRRFVETAKSISRSR